MKFDKIKTIIKDYFKENKPWILLSTGVFVSGMVIGFLIVVIFPIVLEYLLGIFASMLEEEISTMQAQENMRATFLIFQRNLQATLVLSIGGVVFGLISFMGLLFNGVILGIVAGALLVNGKLLFVLATLIPHGVFEIPALLLSGAWGFRIGTEWILDRHKGKRKQVFLSNFKKLLYFIPFLILFLLIAAIIEVYVSGKIALVLGG